MMSDYIQSPLIFAMLVKRRRIQKRQRDGTTQELPALRAIGAVQEMALARSSHEFAEPFGLRKSSGAFFQSERRENIIMRFFKILAPACLCG